VAGIDWLTDQEIRIDSSGEMSFPLAGPVTAAGLTPRELEALLVEQLVKRGQLVNPQVTVNVKETLSRSVTIEGQVKKAGIYPITGKITLLQAIALAQSTDEFSSLDDVVVFRTVGNQRYAALYDLKAIRHGVYEDPAIFSNDIVLVGDDRGRRLFRDLLAIIPLVTTPLVVAIR
jgi:polysaccharide export outer membrane protein